MRPRHLAALAFAAPVFALQAACGGNEKIGDAAIRNAENADTARRGDTIAVPAAAIDTETNRPAGRAHRDSNPATAVGVDTPITRRIGSPAKSRP